MREVYWVCDMLHGLDGGLLEWYGTSVRGIGVPGNADSDPLYGRVASWLTSKTWLWILLTTIPFRLRDTSKPAIVSVLRLILLVWFYTPHKDLPQNHLGLFNIEPPPYYQVS